MNIKYYEFRKDLTKKLNDSIVLCILKNVWISFNCYTALFPFDCVSFDFDDLEFIVINV